MNNNRDIKAKYIREIGNRYGKLSIEDVYKSGIDGSIWCKCRCECGKEVTKRLHNVVSGKTKSCGCIFKECFKGRKERSRREKEWIIGEIERGKSINKISEESGYSRQTISLYVNYYKREGKIGNGERSKVK